LSRNTIVAAAPCPELLGAGDVLRPWQDEGSFASLPWESDWDVLQPATLALLDARFARIICPWPSIFAALLERMMERQRWMSLQVAVGHLRRVDARILILLWHLGDRWGTMRPEGVHLPMRLTHAYIARLIGAQRPSVTLALTELAELGRLRRERDGSWVLLRPVPELADLLAQTGGQRRRGEVPR
jgi:CRP-like cAMP-binding protein